MKNIFLKERADELTYTQFDNCCEHPAFRKGALMPDAHGGYDAPIGSVIALKDWVVPSWVGYDIGCGMCAIRLNIKKDDINNLEELHAKLHRNIPCGDSYHADGRLFTLKINRKSIAIREALEKRRVAQQFGTLGTGNHFLELSTDNDNNVWIVIHSGSRGFGWAVADHWMKRQKEETSNLGWYSKSKDGHQYIEDMNICLHYALENRKQMIDSAIETIARHIDMANLEGDKDTFINRNHNHMDIAHGYCIHRKGATHAEKDMMGVIPANMRDGAFIVKGLGNEDSLWSSSHGAGRKLSRKAANQELSLDVFKEQMVGIVGDVKEATLDEAPDAYKNIYDVMEMQVENKMLEVVLHIKPFLNIKG